MGYTVARVCFVVAPAAFVAVECPEKCSPLPDAIFIPELLQAYKPLTAVFTARILTL
jgi:hypothetical protein